MTLRPSIRFEAGRCVTGQGARAVDDLEEGGERREGVEGTTGDG